GPSLRPPPAVGSMLAFAVAAAGGRPRAAAALTAETRAAAPVGAWPWALGAATLAGRAPACAAGPGRGGLAAAAAAACALRLSRACRAPGGSRVKAPARTRGFRASSHKSHSQEAATSLRAYESSYLELETAEVEQVAPAKPVRVRFAPSPTGVLHVGGARTTALFNWLFAKSQGGQLVLRVEDTDVARSTEESEDAILEGLRWCGIDWDEGPDVGGPKGPYRQSERIKAGVYQEQLDKLLAQGNAYKCFLTPEELDAMRAEAERNEVAFVVDSPWKNATKEEIQEMLDKNVPFVYRFRIPYDEEIVIDDAVLGEVTWNSDDLGGDFIIMRQNGMPMYNFAVVVDDALMDITYVLRAQEHLMNTPRQYLIYKALGLPVPKFGHMPLILAPDRSKLSKRHGAVSVGQYAQMGFLPSGLVNYLAQLGWNDGTNKEIYDTRELLDAFTLDRMSKVAAIFDTDKCKWVNGHHIRLLPDEKSEELIGGELVKQGLAKEASGEFVRRASALLRDRIGTLTEAGEELKRMMAYDLEGMLASDKAKQWLEDGSLKETAALLVEAHARGDFDAVSSDTAVLKEIAKGIGEARGGAKKKKLLVPLRLCLTADDTGPDMGRFFHMLSCVDDGVTCESVSLDRRMELLKEKFEL
ncbi:unnamed protein product, partial [Prorocentrum cordatum]